MYYGIIQLRYYPINKCFYEVITVTSVSDVYPLPNALNLKMFSPWSLQTQIRTSLLETVVRTLP